MEKSPEAFRTISEVADALDVPPHVLRFWETRFTQVKPVKRGGGRRYYRPEDVRLLRGIRGLLYDEGMTIKGVQKVLRDRGIRHVIGLGTLLVGEMGPEATDPGGLPSDTKEPAIRPPLSDATDPGHAASGEKRGEPMRMDEEFDSSVLVDTITEVTVRQTSGQFDTAAIAALLTKLEELRAVMLQDPET